MAGSTINTNITRKPAASGSSGTLELPKAILMAIRTAGVYDEISIDPASGQVLERIHLTGRYDSYSDTYELNGSRWKIEGHKSWPNGEDTYTMKLEVPFSTADSVMLKKKVAEQRRVGKTFTDRFT